MQNNHVEVKVSREIISRAISEIVPNADKIGKRGFFDGNTLQKIMGRIGEIVTGQYMEFEADDYIGVNIDGSPDKGDYLQSELTIDVKTSYSTEYRKNGKVPEDWGLLVPESQFRFQPHDFYVRCAVNSNHPWGITKLCFVGACMKKAVAEFAELEDWECKQPTECIVPMRVVKPKYMFSIDMLKRHFDSLRIEKEESDEKASND